MSIANLLLNRGFGKKASFDKTAICSDTYTTIGSCDLSGRVGIVVAKLKVITNDGENVNIQFIYQTVYQSGSCDKLGNQLWSWEVRRLDLPYYEHHTGERILVDFTIDNNTLVASLKQNHQKNCVVYSRLTIQE